VGPVGDGATEVAAVDIIEGLREAPGVFDIVDFECYIRRNKIWLSRTEIIS